VLVREGGHSNHLISINLGISKIKELKKGRKGEATQLKRSRGGRGNGTPTIKGGGLPVHRTASFRQSPHDKIEKGLKRGGKDM